MAKLVKNKNRALPWWAGLAAAVAAFAAVLSIFITAVAKTQRGAEEQELALVEKAVDRAVVSCYAMEGFYPPSIDYLVEHYGLEVDLDKYYIHHEAFASNVFPTIWVVRR